MRIDQGLQQPDAALLCLPSLFAQLVVFIQIGVTRPPPSAALLIRSIRMRDVPHRDLSSV
jgi:hypothetical protein